MYEIDEFIEIIPIDCYVYAIPILTPDEKVIFAAIDSEKSYTINLNKKGWNRHGVDLIYIEELKDWYPAELFNITEIKKDGPRSKE